MTLLDSPSTLQASGSELMAPDPMSVDASAIDRNLRAIRQVQSGWRLPELPDEVMLDLAGQPMDHRGISDFLSGLERDAFNENPEDFTAPATPQLSVVSNMGEYGPLAVDGFTRAMSTINSLRGMSPAEVLDADATQRWKLRAIDQGFLTAPEDGVVDSSWSPELGAIQRQMQYSEFNDKMRGDRPGAMPFGRAMGILADWTSPSGLMRAAVDLDLFWDTGQIGREIDSWGDKWRKVGDSKNPLDFGKNLFDALTGPIDDIVVPALNMALLFTGVGHATNFARLAITGTSAVKAAETVTFMNRLYELPKVGTLIGKIFPAADAAGLAKASWTAEKFMGSSRPLLQAAGTRMAAWRELPTVIGTRGIVQQGMRLGIASQVENRLLPNYQGSGSLSDIPAVASLTDRALSNPWVTGIGEVLFTPYTIFEPGTFINGGKSAVAGAFKYLGTTQGRMAAGAVIGAGVASVGVADGGDVLQGAAIGAGAAAAAPTVGRWMRDGMEVLEFGGHKVPLLSKAVKGVGKSLAHLNWEPIGNDQRMSQVFMDAMRAKLEPEAWAGFEQGIVKQGFLKTLADHVGTDEKGASAMMGYVALSASIDATAAMQAGVAGSSGWHERYYLLRNKLNAQITPFTEDTNPAEVAWAIAKGEGLTGKNAKQRMNSLLQQIDERPEVFAEVLANHNVQAQGHVRQLLQPDNLPVNQASEFYPLLTKYVSNAVGSFGNWPKYQPALDALNSHVSSGLFEEVRVLAAQSMLGDGKQINVLEYFPEYVPPMDAEKVANWSTHLNDTLFIGGDVSVEQWRKGGGYYNPLASEIDPMRSKVTLMLADTPTKQEYLLAAHELERTLEVTQAHLRAAKVTRKDGEAVIRIMDELDLSSLSAHQLRETLKAAAVGKKDQKAFERVRQFTLHMKAQGVDTGQMFDLALNDFVNSLTADGRWARYGQKSHLADENQKVLGGMDALKARTKQLRKDARFTAAELDVEDLVAKVAASKGQAAADDLRAYFEHASSQGYKVVYGADFLMPNELLAQNAMFADINERHMNAMTLGNFFGRRHPEELALNVQMARQRSIARQLGKIHGDVAVDDERVLTALDDVYHHVLDPELQRNSAMISDLRHQSMTERWGSALRTSKQPQSMQDLGLGSNRKRVTDKLMQMGWSEKEAGAVWQGLKEARYAEWRDMGLYAIEAKLRGRNQFIDALHVLGGTPNAKVLRTAAGGAAMGAAYGLATSEDTEGILADAAIGAVGRPLAGQLTKRVEKAIDLKEWARYGYLADNLAALRDRLRFSLSPFFDMSRYCLAPDTKVLTEDLRWVPVGDLEVGAGLVGFDEDPAPGPGRAAGRKWRHAEVTATGRDWLPSYRVHLEDGTSIVCSEQHMWLMARRSATNHAWMTTKELFGRQETSTPGRLDIMRALRVTEVWDEADTRSAGYLAGMFDGEGSCSAPGLRISMAQRQNVALDRTKQHLAEMGFDSSLAWKELPGYDPVATVYLKGGLSESLRFLGQVRPHRLLNAFVDQKKIDGLSRMEAIDKVAIERVEFLGLQEVVTLATSTHTLVAEGFAHHNTEAWMLGQTAAPRRAADGSRIALPLNQSPRALRRSLVAEGGEAFAEGKMRQISDEFMAASRGHFDPGELESTAKWFQSTGLLGFNPTAWMQSTFHHMRQAGLSPDEAYKNVREMYTYGTKARSAFEQSVNFVFFPFSFQKKSLGHLANFISDDLTRSVLIHDAYKAYEALDERYDLGAWAEDHLPVLKKLQQLNMFAFGISPGRLGGINAQAIEAFVGDPTSMDPEKRGMILNLFSPQGVNMASVGTEEFKKLVMKTVPIMNDVKWMINDLKSQGHVLFDPSHMTVAAQTREAYNEWNEYRKGVDAALKNVGASWYDLKNNPGLAPLWEDMQRHKTELEKRYPGWNESKLRGATNRADLAMEKEHRLNMVQFFPEEATLADYQFAQMEQTLDALKAIMGQYGITDWEDAPPSEYARVKGVAIEMVRQNRAFLMVWNKFYRNDFGDITSDVEV